MPASQPAAQPNSPPKQVLSTEPIMDPILKKPRHFRLSKRTQAAPLQPPSATPATGQRAAARAAREIERPRPTAPSPVRTPRGTALRPEHPFPGYPLYRDCESDAFPKPPRNGGLPYEPNFRPRNSRSAGSPAGRRPPASRQRPAVTALAPAPPAGIRPSDPMFPST
jgi:hypothetical protein